MLVWTARDENTRCDRSPFRLSRGVLLKLRDLTPDYFMLSVSGQSVSVTWCPKNIPSLSIPNVSVSCPAEWLFQGRCADWSDSKFFPCEETNSVFSDKTRGEYQRIIWYSAKEEIAWTSEGVFPLQLFRYALDKICHSEYHGWPISLIIVFV